MMRVGIRSGAIAGCLIFLVIVLFTFTRNSGTARLHNTSSTSDADDGWPAPQDKVVVVPRMPGEDTDWIGSDLPDWQQAVYSMTDAKARFRVPKNKGREAMAYLTYLIDYYDRLPSTIAFIHAHRDGYPQAWHTDSEGYNIVTNLQELRLSYVQEQGYVNLRCIHIPGCPDEIQPFRDPPEGHRDAEHEFPAAMRYLFGNETEIPKSVGVPCCGQFAISKAQALKRDRSEYVHFRDWIVQTTLTDDVSGRVLEYMWHIIFGQGPVACPDPQQCYCNVYGRCNESDG